MIVSANKKDCDPVWFNLLREVESKLPIVLVTKNDGYEFNNDLYKLDKYILVCGTEYGWNFPLEKTRTHLWGQNTEKFLHFTSTEWRKFDEFITENPPELIFKRELIEGDDYDYVRPINYPCWYPIPEAQSKESFEARPLLFNFIWGLSHEYRKVLHGEIWQKAGERNYIVCDNINNLHLFFEKENHGRKVLTANVPWYSRYDMKDIIAINELSKISVSIFGAGRHCFRHSESPMNSVMYMWEDGFKHSYQWVNNVNCIQSEQGKEIETIMEALSNPLLYEIYLAGVENCKKYFLPTYVKNYIEPLINSL